nr:MAG TPA: tail-collar fiber protein [Caudoviricetes sp.]
MQHNDNCVTTVGGDLIMYGFIIPAKGRELIASLLAGDTLTITRCMVGEGKPQEGVEVSELTDLVKPLAQATSTAPIVTRQQVDMTIEYRNDLNGGLENGFYLSEFGIFARGKDGAEVMIYYACLGDYPQYVQPYTKGGAVEVRRFPIAIGVSNTTDVQLDYSADAFITSENLVEYCNSVVLPLFMADVEKRIAAHNADHAAHPFLLGKISDFDARLSLIELQYGTDVNGNPFIVTFENLDSVTVQGVWNEPERRIEF